MKYRWKLEFRSEDKHSLHPNYWLYLIVQSAKYSDTYTHCIPRGLIFGTTGSWNVLLNEISTWVDGASFPALAKKFDTLQSAKFWARHNIRQRNFLHRQAMERDKADAA